MSLDRGDSEDLQRRLIAAEDGLQRQTARLEVLAQTRRDLADASTNYTRLLQVVATRAAELLGDNCIIRLTSDDGLRLETAASHDNNPEFTEVLLEIDAMPVDLSIQDSISTMVFQTGRSMLIPVVDFEQLKKTIQPQFWPLLEKVGMKSLLVVPMRAHNRTLGVLYFWRYRPGLPAYEPDDQGLAEDLAEQAAIAIYNARLIGQLYQALMDRKGAQDELKIAEEQLRQSQKLEAIGRLAGGIAHDFNNLLSVILSYSQLLMKGFQPGDQRRDDLQEIKTAGERAAALIRQLLAFSRRQILEPVVLDLNEVVGRSDRMLRRLIGEDIELASLPDPELRAVRVDPSQIEQVIMNLVVNARDAMPSGGKVTIETANVELDHAYAALHEGVSPGPHVMLAVSDTGMGMDKETQSRIFEPFFTTKEKGKGTGLGLATVFGIVKQSGGSIFVYSEPGNGSTFKVYLPRADEAARPAPRAQPEPVHLRGAETVLLVEDDPQLRLLTSKLLQHSGYTVLEAENGIQALEVSLAHHGEIDLLLTDVVMPKLGGRDLARRIGPSRPKMRVLYMSGYADDAVVHHGVLEPGIAFIQKPLTPDGVTRKVREVLDAPRTLQPI